VRGNPDDPEQSFKKMDIKKYASIDNHNTGINN
jgi:hypothetical protein